MNRINQEINNTTFFEAYEKFQTKEICQESIGNCEVYVEYWINAGRFVVVVDDGAGHDLRVIMFTRSEKEAYKIMKDYIEENMEQETENKYTLADMILDAKIKREFI
jgi:hypothetical protein